MFLHGIPSQVNIFVRRTPVVCFFFRFRLVQDKQLVARLMPVENVSSSHNDTRRKRAFEARGWEHRRVYTLRGKEIEKWRSLTANWGTNALSQANPSSAVISAFAAIEDDDASLVKHM